MGDREFCGVELARWLSEEQKVDLSLRLKKNEYAELKRNYRGKSSKESWFILTNLNSLPLATSAYAKRMGIEEMFRDFKRGGYNLENTRVGDRRLISLILLICLSYSLSTFVGLYVLKISKLKGFYFSQ